MRLSGGYFVKLGLFQYFQPLYIAKLSQAQTEASVLAEISFNFVFTHPPPGKVKKNQSCLKWREMARKLVKNDFGIFSPPPCQKKIGYEKHFCQT